MTKTCPVIELLLEKLFNYVIFFVNTIGIFTQQLLTINMKMDLIQ